MSADTQAPTCETCGGCGAVCTPRCSIDGCNDVPCPACLGGEPDPNEPEQVSPARRDSIDRAREAWAAREFGPNPRTEDSWLYRWISLGEHRVFYGPDAGMKARGDRDGAPF